LTGDSIDIKDTKGDVIGVGIDGSGNIIAKELNVFFGDVERGRPATRELRLPPKPSISRGESTKIFVGRNQDMDNAF
jgi:hypothetical protein